ncbi:MAG: hypothetical protein Q9165_001097 [Trypethelium subeluteriae]
MCSTVGKGRIGHGVACPACLVCDNSRRQRKFITGLTEALTAFKQIKILRVVFYLPELERVRLKKKPARWGWECQVTGNRYEDTDIPYRSDKIFYKMPEPIEAVLRAVPSSCRITWEADDKDYDGWRYFLRESKPAQIADDLIKSGVVDR